MPGKRAGHQPIERENAMPKYTVTIDQTSAYEFTIEAENIEDASNAALEVFLKSTDSGDHLAYIGETEVSNVEEVAA